MQNTNPEFALYTACIALLGVLVTALLSYISAKKGRDLQSHLAEEQARLENALLDRKAEVDRQLETIRNGAAADLLLKKAALDNELEAYRAKTAADLAALKSRLDEEVEHRRILVALNEENWRHVHEGIRSLRDAGFSMSSAFKAMANHAHTNVGISEEYLVAECLTALRRHEQFREALTKLRGELRPKDYGDLEDLLKYLVIVFLDVGRTRAERESKIPQMRAHEEEIAAREKKFLALVERFLQSYSKSGPTG